MEDLRVTVVQCTLHWEDPSANRSHISTLLNQVKDTDVIVLPEMFTTGFSMDPERVAEIHIPTAMETLEWMKAESEKHNAALTGSVSVKDGDHYFNRMYWVTPDGQVQHYDKRHLFTFANEDDHYSPGASKKVVHWRGWNILLQICYDLRFPVFMRNTVVNDSPEYDAAIFVANWPAVRSKPWKNLLISRAIENQCYVLASNRVGADGNGIEYSGDSSVIDPKGDYLIEAVPGQEEIVQTELSRKEIGEFRMKFPVLYDQ